MSASWAELWGVLFTEAQGPSGPKVMFRTWADCEVWTECALWTSENAGKELFFWERRVSKQPLAIKHFDSLFQMDFCLEEGICGTKKAYEKQASRDWEQEDVVLWAGPFIY